MALRERAAVRQGRDHTQLFTETWISVLKAGECGLRVMKTMCFINTECDTLAINCSSWHAQGLQYSEICMATAQISNKHSVIKALGAEGTSQNLLLTCTEPVRLNDFRDSYTRVQLEWEINLEQGTVHLPRDETKPGTKGMSVPLKIKRLGNKSKKRNWRKCETPNLRLFLPSAHSHLFTPHQSDLKQPQWHMDTRSGCHRGSLQWPHTPLTRLHQSLTPHLTDSTHHWPDSTNHWYLTSLNPPITDQTQPITDTSPHWLLPSLTRLDQSLC